jgi:hypothetical protein
MNSKNLSDLREHMTESPYRRLQVTISGYWYLGLTVVLGVVALSTTNNLLYLLESLLLGGLILSGLLSEYTVKRVRIRFLPTQAKARTKEEPVAGFDFLEVESTADRDLYGIEIGLWSGSPKAIRPLTYLLKLSARSKLLLKIPHDFFARGEIHWTGYAIGTSGPFGFAKKLRVLQCENPRSRTIWPRLYPTDNKNGHTLYRSGGELLEGELREGTLHEGDLRDRVWSKQRSALQFENSTVLRKRGAPTNSEKSVPERFTFRTPATEDEISQLATALSTTTTSPWTLEWIESAHPLPNLEILRIPPPGGPAKNAPLLDRLARLPQPRRTP